MKATVDQDTCVGCGLCADECPAVFVMTGDVAEARVEEAPVDAEEACRRAAEACPVDAIMIDD